MTIILHVGAAKCGSSSLQAQLSGNPLLSAEDGSARYEYVCITVDGTLLRRDELQAHARLTPYEAQVSAGAEAMWATDPEALRRLSSQLQAVLAEGRTPIVSQESWFRQHKIFQDNDILARLGLRAKVVAFVRPQIPWLNSAWWQWGAWSPYGFSEWVDGNMSSLMWTHQIGAWQSVPGVDEVEIHPGAADVVSTFFRAIGVAIENPRRRNSSLDQNLLTYLRRRTDLRAVHTPVIDFILEQQLGGGSNGSPWVVPFDRTLELIAYYRADNLELRSLVSREAAQAMDQDPMWWDAAAYRGRQTVRADAAEPSIEVLQDISDRAVDAVIRLDQRVRTLEASQHELALALDAQRRLTHAMEVECQLARAAPAGGRAIASPAPEPMALPASA